MFILLGLHIRCTPLESRRRLGSRPFQDHLLVSVTSPTVFLIRVLFELLANSNRPFPFPPIPPTNPPGAHRRAQSRSDSEREKIRYHFYHFKGQLPLVTARNCDSLRVSANAVLFYNSGCRHPLRHASRSRVSVLRNRRLQVRILWGVLEWMKVVGDPSDGP